MSSTDTIEHTKTKRLFHATNGTRVKSEVSFKARGNTPSELPYH